MDANRIKIDATTLQPLSNSCDDLVGSNNMAMATLTLEFTGTKLQDLNEDCLREIFRSKTIDLYDMCSLADTCKRFRQIVQSIAPKGLNIWRRYSGADRYVITLEIMKEPFKFIKDKKQLDKPCGFGMIRRIFENFGPRLASVSIHGCGPHLTDQAALHCKEELKHLTLRFQEFNQCQAIEMQPIFKKLKYLELFSVRLSADANLFAGMDSLVELKLAWVMNGVAILDNTFPKLKRFECKHIEREKWKLYERQLMNTMLPFIVRHNNLKTLQFDHNISEKSAVMLCQTVVHNCKELDTVGLTCDTTRGRRTRTLDCIKILTQLKSLRSLHLKHRSFSDLNVFSAMKELRHLSLTDCSLPLDLNQFNSWAHLTKVHFFDVITPNDVRSFDLVGVIGRLTNIEELQFLKYILDEETVRRIVVVVSGRLQLLRLKCSYDFDWKEFDTGEKLKLL